MLILLMERCKISHSTTWMSAILQVKYLLPVIIVCNGDDWFPVMGLGTCCTPTYNDVELIALPRKL